MINFIKTKEKDKILEELNKRYGIDEIPFQLIRGGNEKIRGFSGNITREQLDKLSQLLRIELIGIYLIKNEHENDFRLSIDAMHLLKDKINKNILELNDKQFKEWIRGYDLDVKVEKGTFIISYKGDFIGSGKSNGERIFNYVPKDRRLRK